MILTYEEFQRLPMQYALGINRDDYCARKFINQQFGICKEIVTERKEVGNIYSGFKKPIVSFYLGNDGDIYKSAREFYEGEFLTPWFDLATHKPVREGFYETDLGMTHWGKYFSTGKFKQPTKWRGMKQVMQRTQA